MKIKAPAGYLFAGINVAIKRKGKNDLGLILSEREAAAAGVFTTNLYLAAPVIVSRERIKKGRATAVLVNSGNANCAMGQQGLSAAKAASAALSRYLRIKDASVLLASTGVIGEPLAYRKIVDGVPALVSRLGPRNYEDFVSAIMTTDTRPKISGCALKLAGREVRIIGFAKGAGMIQPQMATMLGFVLTDAEIKPALLKLLLRASAKASFNRVTIDGDTSTNDTLFALANGASGVEIVSRGKGWPRFKNAFYGVCLDLAQMIAADGEGASKWFLVEVKGAKSASDAEKIARRIANSPLVKTAISAADPNWGRIIAAAGISGAKFNVDKTSLRLVSADGRTRLEIFKAGRRSAGYQGMAAEKRAVQLLKQSGFKILFDAGAGKHRFEMITCDFTQEYVRINAEYRS